MELKAEGLPCICCGSQLINQMPGGGNQPIEGVEFTSRGHYGSRIWDPGNGTMLAINICDGCLEKKIKTKAVALVTPIHRRTDYRYEVME